VNTVVGIISACGAIGAVIAHLGIAVWYYGRLTQKVESNTADICDLKDAVLDHETRISRLEGRGGDAND
jgi:hypothetical protein